MDKILCQPQDLEKAMPQSDRITNQHENGGRILNPAAWRSVFIV